MLMLAAALAATAVAGCSKNNTSQEQDIASDAQEATMPDGAIDEAFGQPSEDETGDAAVQNSNRIYGVITDVSASEQTITVDNQSDVSSTGEMILTIDPSNTEIIDAQTGLPVELSEVQSGSFEAYLGDAMTMSLPPQCTPGYGDRKYCRGCSSTAVCSGSRRSGRCSRFGKCNRTEGNGWKNLCNRQRCTGDTVSYQKYCKTAGSDSRNCLPSVGR